ncbi:hypothetical protein MHUMG1_06843 [Metarhizium humberi]|uniref:DUF6923 domain-containing protein n=1 Tax=Metarhizium humberi TaxID=2596975 RepID=A0A9P8S5I9_9HYPO|nr:hypothetical protein MHUMG1_06843 [Metarhizium humberi]
MITIFVLVALTGLTFANPLDLQPREDVKEDNFDLCRLLGCHRPRTVTWTLVYTITSTATSSATATATATITTTLDCSPSASTTLRTTATTSDFTSTGTSATTATSSNTTASIDTTSTDTASPTDITTSADITTSTDITMSTDITTSTDTTSADTTAAPTTLTDASTDVSGSTGATTSTGVTISTNTTLTGVTTSSDITIPTYTASTTDFTTSADTTTSTEAATSGTTTAKATDTTTAAASTSSSSSSSSSSTTGLQSPLSTLVPFNCSADAFFIQDRLILSVNLQTGERKTLSSSVGGSSARVSAIGFNPLDNFIYGLQNKTVVRVGHDGALQRVAEGDMAANAGDVDSNGQLYYTAGGRAWARVDLKPGSARYGQVVARGTSDSSALPGNLAAGDWAFTPAAPGYLHSVAVGDHGDHGDVYLVRWDLATHRWEVRHKDLPSFGIQGGVFGAVVATSDGVLYASHNLSGVVLRIPLDDPEGTRKVKVRVPRAAFGDGCRCASMPDVDVAV